MVKTLVIHPKDKTTDFLSEIYEGKDWKVINTDLLPHQLREEIEQHDRIIMLGHGIPSGLLGYGKIVINSSYADLLRIKKDNVYIWCNADYFVRKNNLNGFYTGMIISEIGEALYFGIIPKENEVEESNKLFASSIKESIDLDSKLMCEQVRNKYNKNTLNNQIVYYNQYNLYNF